MVSPEGWDLRDMGSDRYGENSPVLFASMYENDEIDWEDGRLRPQMPTKKGEAPKGAQSLIPFDVSFVDADGKVRRLSVDDLIEEREVTVKRRNADGVLESVQEIRKVRIFRSSRV
jgi:hypothetical protein